MAQHRQLTTNGSPDASEFVDQDLTSIPDVGESASAVIGGDDALTSFTMYGSTPANMPRSNTVPGGSTHKPLSPSQSNGMEGLNGATLMEANRNKLDTIKAWSISTFKCTKQILSEKLGKGSKTVDVDLDAQIEALRDTQRKYTNILRLSRALTSHFYHVVQTQKALGETFAELAQKSPELQEEFSCNAETQRVLVRQGEGLLNALNFFTSSVNTLINKTMEDTLQTVKQYESARIEYDAYRTDLEALQLGVKNEPGYGAKLDEVARIYRQHLERFNQLRGDVNIKLKFLEENKVKVMHKQLLLFNRALTAYFSGNKDGLEQALKQFNINLKPPNTTPPSWLEAQ